MKAAATTKVTGTERPSALTITGLAGAIAGLWVGAAAAQGSGISIPIERPVLTPGVRASLLYSDNVTLAPDGSEESDFVFEASPYITAHSNAPRASYNVTYQLRNFWRVRDGETNLFRHALNAAGSFALVDDRFWVDLSGYMGTISASAAGPIAADPAASFTNTANVRRFSISPWYRDRLGNLATYQLRYALAHSAGDTSFAVAKLHHRASASLDGLARELSPWNWRVYGDFERRDFDGGIELDRRQAGALLYYRLNPTLRVYGSVEYEQIDEVFNSDGDNFGYGPGAGFDWTPNARTSVSGSIARRYYGTIGSARAAYTAQSWTTGVQYSRGILTSSDSSLLLFDPTALTSGATGISPILANLIAAGIVPPTGTALTQSLFTDTAVFDRRVTAFWGLYGARNSLTFSAYWSNRESTNEIASTTTITGIRGSSVAGGVFAGELRERGLAAVYVHRLQARSSIDVGADRRISDSATGGFETHTTTLRAGYLTQLTSDTAAFVGARHTRQSASGTGARYDENAIYGGVDMRFR